MKRVFLAVAALLAGFGIRRWFHDDEPLSCQAMERLLSRLPQEPKEPGRIETSAREQEAQRRIKSRWAGADPAFYRPRRRSA